VMKRAISTVCPVFNTSRMVQEYMEKCYGPSAERFDRLVQDQLKLAANLARFRRILAGAWQQIRVESVESNGADPMHVGSQLEVKARVNLGPLSPEDVQVQLFHGVVDNLGEIPHPATALMSHNGAKEGNAFLFKGMIACRSSGQHGYAVRVLPNNPDLASPYEPGLVCWG
jgi:glycogen phosphorylase